MKQIYQKAQFLTSVSHYSQCPTDLGYEVAFGGRSNVGKSSVINSLTQQKRLAKISKTPGRTQLINFFTLDEERRLVDLPGYGYAKVPKAMQKEWRLLISDYLSNRQCFRGMVLIMDVRHPMKDNDLTMLDFCEHYQLPTLVLLNKSDKLSTHQAKQSLFKVQNDLLKRSNSPSCQLFSAKTGLGFTELLQQLNQWFDFE